MLKTGALARLVIPALAATSFHALVAGEPQGTPPTAASIRDWKSTTSASATPAAAPAMARSIHEWMSTTSAPPAATAPCTTQAPPAALPASTPAVAVSAPKIPIAISLTSMLRHGRLVVELDGAPVFKEEFQKPLLLISQTTRWDPLQVASGKHRLSARVYGDKKTYLSATYDLNVSSKKGSELRFLMKGDKLTVEVAS